MNIDAHPKRPTLVHGSAMTHYMPRVGDVLHFDKEESGLQRSNAVAGNGRQEGVLKQE